MKPIETFNLFGEDTEFPDVVHCETIEARSVLHDWEFRPHRHTRLHQFLMIDRGAGRGSFDDRTAELGDGTVANVPTGCVHSYRFETGTEGWVVTVATEVLDQSLHEGEGLRPLLSRPAQIEGTPEIRDAIQAIFKTFHGRDFARAHVLRAQVALLAGLVARRVAESGTPPAPGQAPLQRRFEALVETHFAEHLSVAEYANRLGVTPTHLSRVMRLATGGPATATIVDRLIREARRNLAYSNLSVSEVAYALGYNDPAYFSRVFTRATGMSPRAFRQQLDGV